MRLSDRTESRDNNFNLIRFVAAGLVLLGHSYPLTGQASEPLFGGRSLGYIAVDVFFVTSGLLVTRSLLTRPSLFGFAWARILRIYPALIAAVLFCAVPLGLAMTRLESGAYLADEGVWKFVLVNSTLVAKRMVYELPGVFENNPFPGAVNGSLWTLPWEVRMYALLGALGALAGFARVFGTPSRKRWVSFGVFACTLLFVAGTLHHQWNGWGAGDRKFEGLRLGAMFFLGGSFYLLRAKVVLHHGLALLAALALGIASPFPQAFAALYLGGLAYLVLYLAYVPGGAVRGFNRCGDYSYGLYIYAFPLQQAVVHWFPGLGVAGMFCLAGTLTLALAAVSWHAIEKPALGHKESYRRFTARWRTE